MDRKGHPVKVFDLIFSRRRSLHLSFSLPVRSTKLLCVPLRAQLSGLIDRSLCIGISPEHGVQMASRRSDLPCALSKGPALHFTTTGQR